MLIIYLSFVEFNNILKGTKNNTERKSTYCCQCAYPIYRLVRYVLKFAHVGNWEVGGRTR